MFEGRAVLSLADLPERAAEVDDQEFQHVENPRRGVLDADHQPAFVMKLRAARGVEPHGRVEYIVIAVSEAFRTGRFGLRSRRIVARGVGSGNEQGPGMAAAERVGQHLPEFVRRVGRPQPEIAQRGFAVVTRHGGLGQQDELRPGGYVVQQIEDILLLPLRVAVEFVVTVYVGLDDAHLDRTLVGLFPTAPDGQ